MALPFWTAKWSYLVNEIAVSKDPGLQATSSNTSQMGTVVLSHVTPHLNFHHWRKGVVIHSLCNVTMVRDTARA